MRLKKTDLPINMNTRRIDDGGHFLTQSSQLIHFACPACPPL